MEDGHYLTLTGFYVRACTESGEEPTNYTYDNWNRLTNVTNPDSTTNSRAYDNDNNVTQEVDENGHSTTTTYDGLNHPIEVDRQVDSSPSDDILNYEYYDAVGDRTSIVNGQNETTIYTYDQRRECVETNYPDGEYQECDYNGDGKIVWSTDYNGNHTTYTYDADDRLTNTNFHDGTAYRNTWRSDGVRTALLDSTGTTSWTVNGAKQITQVIEPASGATLSYTYDSSGRKKTLKYGAQTWTFNYDSFNRPASVGQAIGDATPVSFLYNLNCSVQQETLGAGGLTEAFSYDNRGRTVGILYQLSGATQQQTTYTHDGVGNVSTYQDDITGGVSMTTTYGYDSANRLISEARTGGATYNNSYVYDKDGNRKSLIRNGTTNLYSVDSNDNFLSGDGYTVPGYNYHGDPTELLGCGTTSTYQFTYDLSDRPTLLLLPGSIPVFYTYDGDGHRVSKRVGSQTTYYVYDGDAVVAEVSPAAITTYELPGIGYVSANGTSITQNYYQDNSQGSTLSVRASAGTLQSQNEYDAYGVNYSLVAGPHTDFGYVGSKGYVTDDESGLLELGHRYYLPILGRFLTQDPIGQKDDLNLYAYCKNNPALGVDPTGCDVRVYCFYGHRGWSWNPIDWGTATWGSHAMLEVDTPIGPVTGSYAGTWSTDLVTQGELNQPDIYEHGAGCTVNGWDIHTTPQQDAAVFALWARWSNMSTKQLLAYLKTGSEENCAIDGITWKLGQFNAEYPYAWCCSIAGFGIEAAGVPCDDNLTPAGLDQEMLGDSGSFGFPDITQIPMQGQGP